MTGLEGSTPSPSAAIETIGDNDRLPSWSTALYAGCRGFESHRRDFDLDHCAVAQWESAVNPLTHHLVGRFETTLDCRFGVHGLAGSIPAGPTQKQCGPISGHKFVKCFYIATEPKNAEAVLVTDVSQTFFIGHRPWTKHEHYRSNPRSIQNPIRLEPDASAANVGAEP